MLHDDLVPSTTLNFATFSTQTQVTDLSTVSGPVLLALDLTALESSTTTNFETDDSTNPGLTFPSGTLPTLLTEAGQPSHDGTSGVPARFQKAEGCGRRLRRYRPNGPYGCKE